MTNVGIDFMALRNRLTLTADWYVKNTKDILLNVPIPISSGGANDPIQNAGKIRNQGFEFNIGWNESLNKDLSYGVSFLGTYNKNEVIALGEGMQPIESGTIHGGTYTSNTCRLSYRWFLADSDRRLFQQRGGSTGLPEGRCLDSAEC